VVDVGTHETRGDVALGAIARRTLMDGRIGLSDCSGRNMVQVAVVAGGAVVGNARMRKRRDRRPEGRRGVTPIAVLWRREVVCRLVQEWIVGVEPADMAPFATAGNARMNCIQKRSRREYIGRVVADAAIILRGNVIDLFGSCYAGIMAGGAVVLIDAQVIEADAGKTGRIVAVAGGAIQGRRYVIDWLSDTDVAVMAQGAVAGIDEQVIEGRIGKFSGGMAVDAILIVRIGRHVIHEFADADHVVMTQRAVVRDAGMIVDAAGKGAGGMTHRAIFEGWHVVRRLAARGHPMTRSAVVDDATMVENCSGESHGAMATTAIGVRGWVREGFRERVDAVVVIVARRARL